MATHSLPKVTYDGQRMAEDAAAQGLGARELADKTRGKVSERTVYRFLSGEVQTVETAKILARVLGRRVARYIVRAARPEALAS